MALISIGSSELSCLVCNSNVDMASCINIYYTSLPQNGETLASFVLRILRPNTSDLRSSYICFQCYHLFQMLEQAQSNVTNIRSEILKAYQSGEKRKLMKETMSESIETVLDEKNIIPDFAHEEKLEIANALCVIQDTSNLSPEVQLNEVRLEDPKTRDVHGTLTEESLDSINVDLSQVDMPRTSSRLDTTNTTVPSNLRNISNDVQDNSLKFKKSEESSKVVALDDSLQDFVDNCRTSISQETLNEATKDENARTNKETDHLIRQVNGSLYTQYEQCQLCNRLFKSTKNFELHLLRHGGTRPYQCQKCKERFPDLSLANIHCAEMRPKEKNCIGLTTESCENQVVDFSDRDGILPENLFKQIDSRGMNFDQNALNSNSLHCPEDSSQITWKSGRISKYSQKPLKHTCPNCDKKWRTLAELKTHMKSHSNLRPYMCEKCGQAYKHKHALEVHIGMHNGINPFQCSFCKKCFTQKGALMRHLPIHTGETPYQCELCGKRFVHHTSYNMHALSHTGKKSYRCDVCDLALLSTSHLKRHMRVHTGEKPYSCSLCGKRFAERYNLFAHQKIHDSLEISEKGEKKKCNKCEQCDAVFDKKEKVQEHIRKNHNSTTEVSNRWIGHTVDIEQQPLIIDELPKFFTDQSQNQKVDDQHADLVNQWVDVNYSKPPDLESLKMMQVNNSEVQINSVLGSDKLLTEDESYNRNLHTSDDRSFS